MKNETKFTASNLIVFLLSLTILFIICKVVGIIKWSWLAVLSPSILCIILVIAIVVFLMRLK